MPRKDVEFVSGGQRCAGWFYTPAVARRCPVVVMAHGFGATRELGLDAFAKRFCAAGMCVLAFDYRHYGASEGEPRELLSIEAQQADYRAAVAYARAQPEVDPQRVVLWGTSFSGAHVLALAAQDLRPCAVIAQVPFATGAMLRAGAGALRRGVVGLGLSLFDWLTSAFRSEPLYVPILGADGTISALPGSENEQGYRRLLPEGAEPEQRWRNRVAARIGVQANLYEPARGLHRASMPILVVLGDRDTLCPPEYTREACARYANVELVDFPGGHFDCYAGPEFERSIDEQLSFLRKHGLLARSEEDAQTQPRAAR